MIRIKQPVSSALAEITSVETVFDQWHRLDIIHARPKSLRHDGWAAEMSREVMVCNPVSSTLLYIPETDEVLLNQEFRLGALTAGAKDPFLFECSAGGIDADETPEEAATREAREETGSSVTALEKIGVYYSSPGCMAEEFHLFVGRIQKPAPGVFGLAEEGEEIKTHILPATAVLKMLDDGRITNMITGLMLQWFARHHERLKKQWSTP